MKTHLWAALAMASATTLVAAPSSAQAIRTWVSGVGDDANPCSRTAPCKTFAGAISKTFINGEINCLDPGGFGAVTITKSITIDCHEIFASILASSTTGIIVNVVGSANDPLRTVRLRNLNINGAGSSGTVGTRTGIRGINILSAAAVFIEDLLISDFINEGVKDTRAGVGELFINNTTIRNNGGVGILVNGTGGGVNAVVDSSRSMNNSFGVAVGPACNVLMRRSVMSGNNTAGVEADAGSILTVNDSSISSNAIGVQSFGTLRLANNDITFNTTGFSGASVSFGNNRILGNGSLGTAPTAAGGASSDLGEQ